MNCNENDQIDGEKIGTIVNYVIDVLKSSTEKKDYRDPDSGKEIYQKYTRALFEMFGSPDEYVKTLEIKEIKKEVIINEMTNLRPHETQKFEQTIEKVANRAIQVWQANEASETETENLQHKDEIDFNLSETIVLKIYKSGDKLEIILCYIKIGVEKTESRYLFFASKSNKKSYIEYKERKFFLSEYDIKEINSVVKRNKESIELEQKNEL